MKWSYVNDIYVVVVQMGIDTSRNMLLIFEMEGVLFSLYTRDEQTCQIQRKLDWEFGDMSYFFRPFQGEFLKYCLKNYDVAIWTLNITWDRSHFRFQTKFK